MYHSLASVGLSANQNLIKSINRTDLVWFHSKKKSIRTQITAALY